MPLFIICTGVQQREDEKRYVLSADTVLEMKESAVFSAGLVSLLYTFGVIQSYSVRQPIQFSVCPNC